MFKMNLLCHLFSTHVVLSTIFWNMSFVVLLLKLFIITKFICYKLRNKFIIMPIHYISIIKTKGFKNLCESKSRSS